jgi:hypothetical protein
MHDTTILALQIAQILKEYRNLSERFDEVMTAGQLPPDLKVDVVAMCLFIQDLNRRMLNKDINTEDVLTTRRFMQSIRTKFEAAVRAINLTNAA